MRCTSPKLNSGSGANLNALRLLLHRLSHQVQRPLEIEVPAEIREIVIEEMKDHLGMLNDQPNYAHPFPAIRSIESLIAKL